ncbi:hypothetical protein [Alicyclobacillus dauci]|uniref:Uncharacterized protein n=1 Tax=Alicyclobacillus dauci TaxID=1475485 RepID=A0ABY6Z0I5_9BACL|nr:hypothetical protein [Alicyclobacillus dauci]WAH35741.1 hypothetical protein NZD86_15875 [Alicyclobacillus dauci]
MVTHRNVRKYLGQHVQCHTPFGTFQGVVVHLSKHHIILGSVVSREEAMASYPEDGMYRFGPMGPGPGGPVGPGGPTPPPGGGGGWHVAIPIAAILGITAVGMHWW